MSEKRSLKQCVHTPVENRKNLGVNQPNFVPARPFLKVAALSIAFYDREIAELVLKKARIRAREAGEVDLLKVADNVMRLWDAKTASLAIELKDIPLSRVVRFSQIALQCERELLQKAVAAAEGTLRQAPENSDPLSPADLTAFRGEILNEVSRLVAAAPASTNSDRFAPIGGSHSVHEQGGTSHSKSSIIGPNDLQRMLETRDNESAQFLSASGYFSQNAFSTASTRRELAHLASFKATREHSIESKIAFLETQSAEGTREPIGFLHLERLDFEPVDYVKGDLVYTLALVPMETVRVTHREWSKTDTEYTSLVASSLETETEEAVSEKSELTESFGSEQQHSSAFEASATASGGYGPVSISTSVGYSSQNASSVSKEYSAQRTKEVTRSASSRTKKEHKVTFRVATQFELEDTSYREIHNPSATAAVRWDFHRLMRVWDVSLYRYGIRLTYDVVVPEPGSYLLRKYIELENIKREIDKAVEVDVKPEQITRENWQDLADEYDVAMEAPPAQTVSVTAYAEETFSTRTVGRSHLEVSLPKGYEFLSWTADGGALSRNNKSAGFVDPEINLNTSQLNSGHRHSNQFAWRYTYDWSEEEEPTEGSKLTVTVWAQGELTGHALSEWQMRTFERLVDAVSTANEVRRLTLQSRRDALMNELDQVTGLSLRKVEREEIMKAVLRWILGPSFSFYPSDLPNLNLNETGDLEYFDSQSQGVKPEYYEPTLRHGDMIRFLHLAIEWENVNYVLYPYFWTDDYRWDFKQSLNHEDNQHRDFLRAGAARVVLTIRPDFETAFLSLMESGSLSESLPPLHPYVTVAAELKAMASTNYPYTPGPHSDNPANKVDTWKEYTPTGALDVVKGN